ncbi:hypothetical protein CTheo_5246 [Ceratobasidium theobromae]|uniref:AIG1-type G domain-containing protein n=1 Tax=Ceratobasidium theobromae TaxID=1582974 RepID=A0A5N5QHX7_9AGAM|nr:hypothetical protein CTheo_5246 [Ceratobasidium theobromae]
MATAEGGKRTVLKPTQKKVINIVLVGKTGAGKTSFMSLLTNFAKGNTALELEDAKDKEKESTADQRHSQTNEASIYVVDNGTTKINILDTPGLADTRGIDLDKKHGKLINDKIQQMKLIDAVVILANGTDARLEPTTEYTLDTIATMFPRSLIHNIGVVLTRLPLLSLQQFQMDSLKGEMKKCQKWTLENPFALYEGYQKTQSHESPQEREEEEENIQRSYTKAVKMVNDWLVWLDHRQPMPTNEIDQLYNMSTTIDVLIDKALLDVTEASNQFQIWTEKQKELRDATKAKVALENINKEQRYWSREVTKCNNTWCDWDGCHINCHEDCNLPELKDNAQLGNHALEHHRHYKMRKYEVVVPISKEAQQMIADAATAEKQIEAAQKIAHKKLEGINQQIAEARKNVRTLIDEFNKLSLGRSFAGHIHAVIKLLESQKESRKGDSTAGDALKEIDKAISDLKTKLKEIDTAMGDDVSDALSRMKDEGAS